MTRKATIILAVTAGALVTGSVLLIVLGQSKQRKKAYGTAVPPGYALEEIRKIVAR